MTQDDLYFVLKCLDQGLIKSPCLEVGIWEEHNTKGLLENHGIEYFGADLKSGPGVDFQIDFTGRLKTVAEVFAGRTFETVLAMNLLEHTFEPIRVLDNIMSLLRCGGRCVITTPVVWPLHDFPFDCWRINPNFYEEYCRSRGFRLFDEPFEYLRFGPVRNGAGAYVLPEPARGWKQFYSRAVHKLFNTTGRGMFFPSHISLGVVIGKTA